MLSIFAESCHFCDIFAFPSAVPEFTSTYLLNDYYSKITYPITNTIILDTQFLSFVIILT